MFTLFSSIVIIGERYFIPWEPPKKTYYHIFPAGGYKIISGFKKAGKGYYSLVSKKALVEFIVRGEYINESQTYAFIVYCTTPEKVEDFNPALFAILDKVADAMYKNNSDLLREASKIIEKSFPRELKAYINIGISSTPLYVFEINPKETLRIPVVIEAPLGKVSKSYVIVFIMVGEVTEEGYSTSEMCLYISP